MSEKVLDKIKSTDLKAYAVWEPILRADSERWARKASALLNDSRVEHFWVETTRIGEAFQEPLMLLSEPAWDVYLIYPRGTQWEKGSPPKPEDFMHQLRGRLPREKRLDGNALGKRLSEILARP